MNVTAAVLREQGLPLTIESLDSTRRKRAKCSSK